LHNLGSQVLQPVPTVVRLSVVTVAELIGPGLARPAMSDAALDTETAALVARARAGDVQAFGALVDRHARAARRVAAAALAAPDDADDVVQEACVTAWQRLADLTDPEAFRAWLLRITWRKALDRRRSVRRWLSKLVAGDPAVDAPELAPDPGADPEGQAMAGELERAIAIAIRSLPTRLRDPFLLATAHQHRYDDIAEWLQLPVGTVKWRVFEARRVLRAKLAAMGHEVRDA
jgi:RNA polymerase sigma-70 factor, ECF subfamily